MSGILYVLATPIGNLKDLSSRAIETLSNVDLIIAEDTRHSHFLLEHFHIKKPIISLHQHNEEKRVLELIQQLQSGQNLALISDAGTPLIRDPGYLLVKTAHLHQLKVSPIPGPCAAIAALSAAGLPCDRFSFEGFLPSRASQRRAHLMQIQFDPRTLVFYEAPHRILASLEDACAILGEARAAVIARELTKIFETIQTGSLRNLATWLKTNPSQCRGEFVLIIAGAAQTPKEINSSETQRICAILQAELPLSQAVRLSAKILNISKKELYQATLKSHSGDNL